MAVRRRAVRLHGDELSFWELDSGRGDQADGVAAPGAEEREQVVVLVHGVASRGETWVPVLEELARRGDRRRFIAPDLLGHGDSATAHGDYSLGGYATALRDLLAALGHDRATVVGHSLGGGIALQFVYQFPQSSDRLVLVASGGLGLEVSPLLRAAAIPGAEWVLPVLTDRRLITAAGALGRAGRWLGLPEPTGSQREAARSFASLSQSEGRHAFVHTVRSVLDLAGQRLSGTEKLYLAEGLPTLIVWGRGDRMIPVEHAHHAAELLPEAHLEVFDRAGHFPHDDAPGRFTDVLVDFLDRTRPARLGPEDFAARLAAHAHLHDLDSDSAAAVGSRDV